MTLNTSIKIHQYWQMRYNLMWLLASKLLKPAAEADTDGQRFATIQPDPDLRPNRLYVVQNWFEELNRLVPTD